MEQAKVKAPKEATINPNEPIATVGGTPDSVLSGKASTFRGLASSSGWKALTGDMQSQINEMVNKLISQESTDPKIASLQESIKTLNFVVNYPRAIIERSRIEGVRKAQEVEFEEFQKSE